MYYPNISGAQKRPQVKKILRVLVIASSVALLLAPFAAGTPEFTKKENKACTYCHTAVGKPDLNEAGKYYKAHRTLEGYVEKK